MHKTRRTGWPRVAALILIVSAAALWIQDNAKGDKADRERPNIVVIDTDDQRFDDLDVMKNVRKLIASGEPPSPTRTPRLRPAALRARPI